MTQPDQSDAHGGHAVAVVGYTADGLIIKNGWGRDRGMQGYANVGFDYLRLFCDEAQAVKEAAIQVNPGAGELRPTVYLTSRLAGTGTNNLLRLSVFDPREGGLSAIRSLRFEVLGQDSGGMRRRLVEFRHPMPWDGPEPDIRSLCSVGNYRRRTFPRQNTGCR